jgi:hypothetical protein
MFTKVEKISVKKSDGSGAGPEADQVQRTHATTLINGTVIGSTVQYVYVYVVV